MTDQLRDYLKRVVAELHRTKEALVRERRREPVAVVGLARRGPGGADFDADFFGLSRPQALALDPRQRSALESAWEVFEHAGVNPVTARGSGTGVFAGSADRDPEPESADLPRGTSGRLAHLLGFGGPALTVDTACSSPLAPLHLAVESLRRGECPLALVTQSSPAEVVVLLLERLSDATRAGHPVQAVLRGCAVNSTGVADSGARERVVLAALADAGLTAADVDVTARATTGLGAVVELVRAVRHGVVPPGATPWPQGERARRAAVSAFEPRGANAHLVLEEPPADEPPPDEPAPGGERAGAVPWALSATTATALRESADRLRNHVRAGGHDPADVAWTLARGRGAFEHRAVVLGADRDALLTGLDALADDLPAENLFLGRGSGHAPVFVFPGAGEWWAEVARGLLDVDDVFTEHVEACAAALDPRTGVSLLDVLRGEVAAERPDVRHAALFAVTTSLAAVWRAHGVEPVAAVGDARGEIAAACASGSLTLVDAARWVVSPEFESTVDFVGSVRSLLDAGHSRFVELAPHPALATGADRVTVGTPLRDGDLLTALARAHTAGIDVDWTRALTGRRARIVDLPTYPFQRRPHPPAIPEQATDPAAGDRSTWQRIGDLTAARPSGHWLVITPEGGVARELPETPGFARLAVDTTTVTADDLAAALDLGPLAGVLSLLGLDERPHPDLPDVPRGLAATTELVHALAGNPAPLWCVTSGAAPVDGERATPAQARLWALGAAVAAEHPERWGGLLDVSADVDPVTALAAALDHDEDRVAARRSGLWARRPVPACRTAEAGCPPTDPDLEDLDDEQLFALIDQGFGLR
ncbi:beta-ketoacyl synthase N-terminal-like domain-containing protein [Actinosynnema mirum]|uniref:Beta-ketoacyl synthase n=1 Tax=Actinosynnema mirum (strain ATCC 29888 / DSM 43827 / JCM 3225 / NBRC 14064 / NCIMB 13271 / NRRL B-12336 / IMRU 3971 / 101) TaxID=446462 RepID=C6WJZ5_ACTMD|nr:beta-ketoacyl synthase N-terminal-like domain-containing protein [Actinosynnema mirum]ACU38208.1 Beta-ketoacyl synthase [Actinosynnema mirum DSM 43827]